MSDPAAGEELLLPGGLSRGKSTIRHNAPAPRLPAPVKKRPGFDGFAGLPPRPPASLFAAGPPPPPPPPLDVLPERKAGTSSAIRLNAQAPEYAPRLPAPVKQPVFIDGFAGPSPRPPVSIFLAGPPPPPPLVDVVPGHKGGGGSAPPQHGGRGANTATLLHSSTNLGSAGRSYVLPERKAGTSSAIRLNAQAPEFAPRLPAPVKQTVFIDGFAGPSPRPPVSIFLAGPPPPPPPPPLVDVVPGHKGGGGSAPPQHGGKGVNTANLLHGNTNLGSAGRSYVKLYKNVNIAPEPLDQGQDGTCNFFAVAKGLQMKVHKNYVDHSKDCDIITYPNASMRDYCAMRNIRKCDINHPVKDWNKDVRLQKIEYLAKHRGIEAVSGQWPSPERIKLDELVFLGRNISHTSSSRSKGKEAIQQKPRGSSTHSSRSQLPPQDRTGIDGPRWHRSSIPAAALPRQSQLAMRDRSAVDDAPTWSRNNFAAATFRSTEGSSSSMCQALQDQSQAPSSKEIKCAPGTAATKGGSKMSESRPEPTSSRTTLC
ncbi:hypothetical protein QYE76_004874 [Lolium multiflorum]|uniref:Uncharacterized protein n=1 Tax=Lolium multiflorum TaxID=4521 RepID=A0AAD8W1T1_LOLMU|nr:hypothetical protein QYE76_004874 [Lolium multiflorum]